MVEFSSPGCAACEAPREEVCAAVHDSYNMYLLAFTGLTLVVAAIPVLIVDILVMMASIARHAATAARLAAVRVGVEQTTRLISAGDKPTVTPGTLTDWVSALLSRGDASAVAVADKCRKELRKRGYELPVHGVAAPAKNQSGAGVKKGVTFYTAPPPLAGQNSDGDTAERGMSSGGGGGSGNNSARRPKLQQVTPEDTPVSRSAALEPRTSSYFFP